MIRKILNKVKIHFSESEKIIRRAQKTPRYKPIFITSAGLKLHVADFLSVAYQLKEYFFDEEYLLPFSADSKLKIYDLGANMGIATLYFKKKYPNAEVVAYEADPVIYSYLEKNIKQNLTEEQQKSITINSQAVWIAEGVIEFKEEGADSGKITIEGTAGKKVPAIDFRKILEKENEIDFIKMDIEGAEYQVVKSMNELLKKVKFLFIESHFSPANNEPFDILIKTLHDNGFEYYLKNTNPFRRPLVEVLNKKIPYQVCIYACNRKFC